MTVAGFFLTVNALMFTKCFFAGRYYLVSCAALETIFCYVKKLKYIPILKAKIKSLKRVEESLKSQTVPTLSLDHVLIGTFEIIKEKKRELLEWCNKSDTDGAFPLGTFGRTESDRATPICISITSFTTQG